MLWTLPHPTFAFWTFPQHRLTTHQPLHRSAPFLVDTSSIVSSRRSPSLVRYAFTVVELLRDLRGATSKAPGIFGLDRGSLVVLSGFAIAYSNSKVCLTALCPCPSPGESTCCIRPLPIAPAVPRTKGHFILVHTPLPIALHRFTSLIHHPTSLYKPYTSSYIVLLRSTSSTSIPFVVVVSVSTVHRSPSFTSPSITSDCSSSLPGLCSCRIVVPRS